ncbi:MAG: methyltransferase domain-containing protein [Sphingobacteriales bacterium]|nr:MAG: methyltransferase domain-containing protein [Sphingobacteriales bacterium]
MPTPKVFTDLLVHPVHKTPLHPDENGTALVDPATGDRFPVREGVPVLLTADIRPELSKTERHAAAGTAFSYKEHYQNDAVAYDYFDETTHPVERTEIVRLREMILSRIPANAAWVLDIGCGGSWLAKALVPSGRNVISTDISDINPIKAIRKLPAANHFGLVADVFELPLQPASMDCIVASEIIEHVPDPRRFINCLFEVLKPGGKLIITTPHNELIRTSLCIHCNRLTPHNAHLHSFTESSLAAMAPAAARRVSTRVFNSKLWVKTSVQHLFRGAPLSLWDPLDKLGIAVTGKKAYRLMAEIIR